VSALERMKLISPDLKADFEFFKAKRYTWKRIAEAYGEDYDEVKEIAKSFGMAKRGSTKMAATTGKTFRCTRAQAEAIAAEVGISVKTVLDRVYRNPKLTLEQVRQYSIEARQRGRGGIRLRVKK
jgi:hypothetical protein